MLNLYAVCDEYVGLATMVRDSIVVHTERKRQEAVHIRVETVLSQSDPSLLCVLSVRLVPSREILKVSVVNAHVS